MTGPGCSAEPSPLASRAADRSHCRVRIGPHRAASAPASSGLVPSACSFSQPEHTGVTPIPAADAPSEQRASGAIGRAPRGQLSDLLVRSGVVSADTVAQALQHQDFTGKRLGTILIESGAIDEFQLAAAIAHQSGLPVVDLVESEPSRSAASVIDGRTARSLKAIPLRTDAFVLDVAVANGRPNTRERLESATGKTVRLYVAPEVQIETLLDAMYPPSASDPQGVGEYGMTSRPTDARIAGGSPEFRQYAPTTEPTERDHASGSSIDGHDNADRSLPLPPSPSVAGWHQLICSATDPLAALLQLTLAADVMTVGVDMFAAATRLRLEYPKNKVEFFTIPNDVGRHLVAATHAAIGYEAGERRRAGTGQFEPMDTFPGTVVRVDSLPTMLGHTLTLRILRDSAELRELNDLGLPSDILEQIRTAIASTHGLFIITGQSGSGRSTTLHAIVREAIRHDKRVLLLEADQRQLVVGASQARLDGASPHLTIRAARSMDVDLVAIDGIHDSLSARQALEGALDGNLIFASMHSRSAADAIEQLLWLASEPTAVAGAVRLVLGQTVVEMRCEDCRDITSPRTAASASSRPSRFSWQDGTCSTCAGPSGRRHAVVFEALEPPPDMRRAIATFDGPPN